ncbi:6-hydroxymethylpterin diphosphokinase MptE-like protein [Shewanella sp. 30m-9]
MQSANLNTFNTFAISQFNEYYLPSVNRQAFEKVDSKTHFDKMFKASFTRENQLHIIIGLDSGLLANYVLELAFPEDSQFIFVELETVLDVLSVDIPDELKQKITICSINELNEELNCRNNPIFITKDKLQVHQSLAVKSQHLQEYSQLNSDVIKLVNQARCEHKSSFNQEVFVEQQLLNLTENHIPASILKHRYQGKTCIVTAGGPSLDDHLGWIKANRDDLFIIAVSRVAAKLTKEGVAPQIIVSVDPQELSLEVNSEMMALHETSLLIHSYHVCARILSQWSGRHLFTGTRLLWDETDDKGNIDSVGPTVTNAAIEIAAKLGFTQVLLTGADFCYSQTGHTHTSGTLEANLGPNMGHIGEWVETYSGDKAETIFQLTEAKKALAYQVNTLDNCKVINLSINAAVVPNIDYLPLDNIIIEPANCCHKTLLAFVDSYTVSPTKHYQYCLKQVSQVVKDLQEITQLAQSALTLVHKAKNAALLEKIEYKINKRHSKIAKVIKFYGYLAFSRFLSTSDSSKWSQSQIEQMSIDYYQAFVSVSERLLTIIKQAEKRCYSRLAELNPQTELAQLIRQWQQDNQPGRALVWAHHLPRELTPGELEATEPLVHEFKLQLTDHQRYKSKLATGYSLEDVFDKLVTLVLDKNLQGLALMVNTLSTRVTESDLAKRLYHLANSYYLELQGDSQQALSTLLELSSEQFTEVEFKQISILALRLGQLELAAIALQQLVTFSDDYLPQYAHILKLQGQAQFALNTYMDYLNKYTDDILVWLKLGSFLIEIEQIQTAKDVFQQVLNLDPTNQIAANQLTKII